jgi:hypothetical protein
MEAMMAKVTGIGGVFFKSIHDSALLKAILSVASDVRTLLLFGETPFFAA